MLLLFWNCPVDGQELEFESRVSGVLSRCLRSDTTIPNRPPPLRDGIVHYPEFCSLHNITCPLTFLYFSIRQCGVL